MSEKITGYLLLVIGVGVILLALLNGYGIFTGALRPVQFLNFSGISLDLGSLTGGVVATGKSAELFSGKDLSTSTNFFLHLVMLGFFINVGFKLGTLGIQLLRPIKIEVKDNKIIQ